MQFAMPFELNAWIEQNQASLRPPVGNKLLFGNGDLIVMAVGGPNARKDFHHDPGPEFFYQVRGDMNLRVFEDGRPIDIPIRQGEIFMLPAEIPHSPQRAADTVGLVIERRRRAGELDGFSWYCESCARLLDEVRVPVENLETELPQVLADFFADSARSTCRHCGTRMKP